MQGSHRNFLSPSFLRNSTIGVGGFYHWHFGPHKSSRPAMNATQNMFLFIKKTCHKRYVNICVLDNTTMFHRILCLGLSPVVKIQHHRSRVISSIGDLVCMKRSFTNLQPFLSQIRELILAERGVSFNETGRLLAVASSYFREDDAVQAAVKSIVVTLARQNKPVCISQDNVCRFISNCGQLQNVMPVSTCDYLSTLLMYRSHKHRNDLSSFHWTRVLSTFARASYDPASPVIAYIVKEIVEKLMQPGGFSYSSSFAYTIAQCVAVYPTPSFIDAVRKVVIPHVVRGVKYENKHYRFMDKLLDSGCLTEDYVRAVGLRTLNVRKCSSPLLCKMILRDLNLTIEWMLYNSWRLRSATATKELKETMETCVSIVLTTDPRTVTLLQGLTSIIALYRARGPSKDCRISEFCEAMLGELAGRPLKVCSGVEVMKVSLLLKKEAFFCGAERLGRMFHERIGVPLFRAYFLQGDFRKMTAKNLLAIFPWVHAYPKVFGTFELRLVLNRLWELQTDGNFLSKFGLSDNRTFMVWRAVVRTGLRRTPFFDAFLPWSLLPPYHKNDQENRLVGALAIVAVPHKHGAYRSVEMATMRTLFKRVAPQFLNAHDLNLLLVAAAQVGLRDTVLLEALARRALILVPTMNTAELVASVVWALCRLRLVVSALLRALVIRLHAIEGGVTSHGKHVVASLKSLT